MTKHQLNTLFDHFQLPRNYSENAFSELKKILLLELKSSDNQTITIGKDSWTKNDIIQFFDSPLTEGFDLTAFYEKYPWAELITTPQKILNARGVTNNAFEDPLFDKFRSEVAVHFEQEYARLIKELMAARKDTIINIKLHYLGGFQYEFQNNLRITLRSMMNTRLNSVSANVRDPQFQNKTSEFAFLKQHGYYELLKQIGDSDSDLIIKNLDTLAACLNHMDVHTIKSIIKKQRDLPLSPNGIHFLDEIQLQVDNILRKRRITSGDTSEGSGNGRAILSVISIVFGIFVAVARCNNHSNRHSTVNIEEMQRMQEQFQQMQQQYPPKNDVQVHEFGDDSVQIINNGDTMYTKKGLFVVPTNPDSLY